jgi:hypothetical protein
MEDTINPRVSWKKSEESFSTNYFVLTSSDNKIYLAEEIDKVIKEKENIKYMIAVEIQEKLDKQKQFIANVFNVTSVDENDSKLSTNILYENSYKIRNDGNESESGWKDEPHIDYLRAAHKAIINALNFHEWAKENPDWKNILQNKNKEEF